MGKFCGQMVRHMKENGQKIKCTALDVLHGLMADNIMVNILRIKNKVMVYLK